MGKKRILVVLGAGPPGGLAENELKLSLSQGRKIIDILFGKMGILEVLGAEPPGGLAENDLKLSLSKGRKIIEIP